MLRGATAGPEGEGEDEEGGGGGVEEVALVAEVDAWRAADELQAVALLLALAEERASLCKAVRPEDEAMLLVCVMVVEDRKAKVVQRRRPPLLIFVVSSVSDQRARASESDPLPARPNQP